MAKARRKRYSRRQKVGLPPGTLVTIGKEGTGQTSLCLTRYSPQTFTTQKFKSLSEFKEQVLPDDNVLWVHAEGLRDLKEIEGLGQLFRIHPLTLEDVANSQHRPKIEVFDHYVHFVIKALNYDLAARTVLEDQINVILGQNFVLSFSESGNGYFEPIFNRLSTGRGIIRNMKADYLAYSLLDYVVDNYFIVLENFEMMLDDLEKAVFDDVTHKMVSTLYEFKRQGLQIRKITGPVKEMVASTRRQKSHLIREETESYFKDLLDHISEVHDSFEAVRAGLVSLVDVSFANSTERANGVMKALAMISAIFLPLNFIVGIFGMNFSHIPGLESHLGFWAVIVSMVVVTAGLVVVFKRKAWW